jgi:hypothetical protein
VAELVSLSEQLLESLLDVVTDAIDQGGQAPVLGCPRKGTAPVSCQTFLGSETTNDANGATLARHHRVVLARAS